MQNENMYLELIKLSQEIWGQQRYWSTISGPYNLERDQSPAELLEQVAKKVDATIAKILPVEYATTTAPLRRAYTYYALGKPLIL